MRNNVLWLVILSVLGSLPTDAQRVKFRPVKALADSELPPAVDNSRLKFFPPVIDQLGGSCAQAAGIGHMLTYEVNRLLDRDASASADNRLSYQFAWNMLNDGIDQGSFVDQGLVLARNYGMMTEADYGKHFMFKWPSGYEKYHRAMRYRADKIYTYDDDIQLMKRYLYDHGDGSPTGGVLTFSGQSLGWVFNKSYDGPSLTGYHSLMTGLGDDGSHAMTIAGYDDTVSFTDDEGRRHDGAFIVVNSWGTWFQDQGRFYLPYDFFRDPLVKPIQLSDQVEGVSACTYEPQVVLKVRLSYTSRDDLRYGLSTTDELQRTVPRSQNYTSVFCNQGGDMPMTGPQFGNELEFALDMTPYVKPTDRKYLFNIVRSMYGQKKGEGQLLALSAIDYRGAEPKEFVCRDVLPATLADGANYFGIPLVPRYTTSASPLRYTDETGNLSVGTYLIRTADGSHAKVRFSTPDTQAQTITIRYEVRGER